MAKSLVFKQGMKVRFTDGAIIHKTEVKVKGLVGHAVGRISNRFVVKLSPDSLNSLLSENPQAKNWIFNNELIIVEINFIEALDKNCISTGYQYRIAHVGGPSFLVGALIFSVIASIAGLVSFVNARNLLFPLPQHTGEFWAALIPGIVAVILLIVIVSFIRTFIIWLRIKFSNNTVEAKIIDMNYYRIGSRDICNILYLSSKNLMIEQISYSKFVKLQIDDLISVKTFGKNSKHFRSV